MSNTVSLKPAPRPAAFSISISIAALTYSSSDSRDGELLRPFDVVADRRHVDARPRHLDLVVDLDGLQLDHPPAGEPGERDVLRHLGVRPRRRAERRRGAMFVERDGEIAPRRGFDEALRGEIED